MVVTVSVLVLVEVERLLDEEAVRGVGVVVGVMVGVVAVPRGLVLLVRTSVHLITILDGTIITAGNGLHVVWKYVRTEGGRGVEEWLSMTAKFFGILGTIPPPPLHPHFQFSLHAKCTF